MSLDHFAHKADSFDANPVRVDNVDAIARVLRDTVALDPAMRLLDFGSGTGLLLERLAPHVAHITAVDVSPAMNRQLDAKRAHLPCTVEILELDLVAHDLAQTFDGIVSSMTLHHVADVAALLRKFHGLMPDGGFIALADLDTEDGSFHSEDTGVFHAGFERAYIAGLAAAAGFREVQVHSASVVRKPQGDYPVFLLTAVR